MAGRLLLSELNHKCNSMDNASIFASAGSPAEYYASTDEEKEERSDDTVPPMLTNENMDGDYTYAPQSRYRYSPTIVFPVHFYLH